MAISEREIKRAEERMTAKRDDAFAVGAHYDEDRGRVVVLLNNGLELTFPPQIAQGLETATPKDLRTVEVTPSGLGLHWPEIDADLYVPSLLEGTLGSRRWMAARLGAAGGRSRSSAKASAARENGKRGGRPRKSQTARRTR
ncbi:MAG: DUF2442 domain-containing protein [Thermoanaerobaculia bacterium]